MKGSRNEPAHRTTQAVEHTDEGDDVQHAQRPELPFVEQQTEAVLCPSRAPPQMTHADKEDADRPSNADSPFGDDMQRELALDGACAHPHAHDPYPLPGEEIEGAPFLQGNGQMRNAHNIVLDCSAEAELRQQPDSGMPRMTGPQLRFTAIENANGDASRKMTYIGRMSSSGGQ